MKSQIAKPTLTPSESDKFLNFEVTINFRSAEPLKYASLSNNQPSKKIHDRKGSETRQPRSKLVEDVPIKKNGSSVVEKQVVPNPVKFRTSNDQPKVESKSETKPRSEKEKKPKEQTTKKSEELTVYHEPVVEPPEVSAKEEAKAATTAKPEKVEPDKVEPEQVEPEKVEPEKMQPVQSKSPVPRRKSGKSKREKPEPLTKDQLSESAKKIDKKRSRKGRPVPSSKVECSIDEVEETCAKVELEDYCSPKLASPVDGEMSFVMLGIDLEAMTVQVFPCPTDMKNELPKQSEAREKSKTVALSRRARN